MSKEIILAKTDLENAGISANINQNDLVEVIAHEIYEKFYNGVEETIREGNAIQKKYYELMDAELTEMKNQLITGGFIVKEDEESLYTSFDRDNKMSGYWNGMSLLKMEISEKDRGTFVTSNKDKSLSFPPEKSRDAFVKLNIKIDDQQKDSDISIAKGITGTIQINTNKQFQKVIKVPNARFKEFAKVIKEHNTKVSKVIEFLPKNGILSVERFTREARVKMNKKIISQQSSEFRTKMSALFGIDL